jgi:hypothetical protein
LAKWFAARSERDKTKTVREVAQLVLNRKKGACAFVEWKGPFLIMYRRAGRES